MITCLVDLLVCWLVGWLITCEARAVEHQKLNQTTPSVEFLSLNLLALVWLELFGLVIFLGLHLVGLVACLAFVCFAVLGLPALVCYGTICDACHGRFHLACLA